MSTLREARLAAERKDVRTAANILSAYLTEHGHVISPTLAASIKLCISIYTRQAQKNGDFIVQPAFSSRKHNRVAILVNASHAHETERTFWQSFANTFASKGFFVAELNYRKVEPYAGVATKVWPARLSDLRRAYSGCDLLPWPPWLTPELVDLYVDWEHRRWQIEKFDPAVREGVILLAKYLELVITTIEPSLVITTNKIDTPNQFAYQAANFHGITYRFAERSPFNSYLVEERGMFGESLVVENVIRSLTTIPKPSGDRAEIEAALAILLDNPYGFRADEATRSADIDRSEQVDGKPRFFLPLDNVLWTGWAQTNHPQRLIDYPVFASPEEALRVISHAVERLGGTLTVKPHPSCREWRRIATAVPSVQFIDGDLDLLCSQADVVVTFLTKVAYLAVGKRKPVVSFGAGLLDRLGVTYQARSQDEVLKALKRAAQQFKLDEKLKLFEVLLPHLRGQNFETGAQAADALFPVLEAKVRAHNEASLHNVADVGKFLGAAEGIRKAVAKAVPKTASQPIQSDVIDVVFDATRLLNPKLWLSGISRYARATIEGLCALPNVRLTCGYMAPKVDHGMAAAHFQFVRDQLPVAIEPLTEAIRQREAAGRSFIYHSPVSPLLDTAKPVHVRRVLTIHDVLHLTMPDIYPAGSAYTESVIKSVDLKRDWVVFDSEYSRQDFFQYVGEQSDRTGVVPLGVSGVFTVRHRAASRRVGQLLPTGTQAICFPFQGDPRKGFSRMLNIGLRWLGADANKRLCVFGKRSFEPELRRQLSALQAEDRGWQVLYLHEPSDEEVAELYRRCDCHMYLSEAEGFGLPPVEAMATGCPSVMMANTSLGEVYADWELMLASNATDADVFAAVERASLPELGLKLRERAQAFSRRYTWERSVANLLMNYHLALLGPPESATASSTRAAESAH